MKYLKIAFGLVIVAGLMAVAASPAMARQGWVQCRENTGKGQWENSKCTTAKANGNWETKEITETLETTSSGSLELEDSKATGGATAVQCSGAGTGTVGSGGSGSVKTVTATGCKFVAGKVGSCEESKGVTTRAVNLPWSTKLEERSGGEVRNVITSTVAGKAPGYATECTVGGVFKISDECTGVTSANVRPNRAKTVETEFDKTSEPGTCSVGGEKAGFLRGVIFISVRILFIILIDIWIYFF
jgi:hypothetical protein